MMTRAYAGENGLTAADALRSLFLRGTQFDSTAATNPAIREEELLRRTRARRLAREGGDGFSKP